MRTLLTVLTMSSKKLSYLFGKDADATPSIPAILATKAQAAIHGGPAELGELARIIKSAVMQNWAEAADEASKHRALRRRSTRRLS